MSVRLTPEEVARYLASAHTMIVSTIGADGFPHSVPVWFLYRDNAIIFRSQNRQQKTVNLLRDPRICLLAEGGKAFLELNAVMIRGVAQTLEGEAEMKRYMAELEARYKGYFRPDERLSDASQKYYAVPHTLFRIPLAGARIASWDNRKLELRA